MRIPLGWLSTFIALEAPISEIAQRLTELGLEVDAIEVLDNQKDTVLEVSLTPNLGHCMSILGVARELAAVYRTPVVIPPCDLKEGSGKNIEASVSLSVVDAVRCPRYACRLIKNVTIAPSPEWLQQALLASGLRPVNNIVDITNYVLLELGHPLHAFDFDCLKGGSITVRTAEKGTKFTTLDGKERILSETDLLICDAKDPVAIAGVMGGADSEVSDATKNILLESAYFIPQTIRRTSQRLGLQTDASKRFERGTDPNMVVTALNRAAKLIAEIAGGEIAPGTLDVSKGEFPPHQIRCRVQRVNALLGTTLSLNEVESTLQRLHLKTDAIEGETLLVTVPTYRCDLAEEIDLVEEVARIYGYDNIRKEVMAYQSSTQPHSPLFLFEREVRNRLIAEGLQEFLSCDLISPTLQQRLNGGEMPQDAAIHVMNPVSEEQSVLRTSLLPAFLVLVRYNQDRQIHDLAGFEIGRVFFKEEEGYREQSVAGIVMSGKQRPASWDQKPFSVDFFDLKGIIENLLTQIGIKDIRFQVSSFDTLHPGRQASLFVGNLEVATLGEVHPSVLRQMDIQQPVLFAEISLQDLMKQRTELTTMKPLSRFPGSSRDWTITLNEETPVQVIFNAIKEANSSLLEETILTDLFRDAEKLGANRKNVTFRLNYRNPNKTVSQEAVDAEHARIIGETTKTLQR